MFIISRHKINNTNIENNLSKPSAHQSWSISGWRGWGDHPDAVPLTFHFWLRVKTLCWHWMSRKSSWWACPEEDDSAQAPHCTSFHQTKLVRGWCSPAVGFSPLGCMGHRSLVLNGVKHTSLWSKKFFSYEQFFRVGSDQCPQGLSMFASS